MLRTSGSWNHAPWLKSGAVQRVFTSDALGRKNSSCSLPSPRTRPVSLRAKNGINAKNITRLLPSISPAPGSRIASKPAANPPPRRSPLTICSTKKKTAAAIANRNDFQIVGKMSGLSSCLFPRRRYSPARMTLLRNQSVHKTRSVFERLVRKLIQQKHAVCRKCQESWGDEQDSKKVSHFVRDSSFQAGFLHLWIEIRAPLAVIYLNVAPVTCQRNVCCRA